MAGHSVPIDFRVDPAKITNPVERSTLLQDLLHILEPYMGKQTQICNLELGGGNHMTVYTVGDTTLSVKLYSNGLVTATWEYYVDDMHSHKIINDDGREIESQLKSKFKCEVVKCLSALKRAPFLNPYFLAADDRILEYDVDSLVFKEQTAFQKVEIYHTKSFGHLLVLDDLQNLAESDLPYTRGLMNAEVENFTDKEVLILGGGDGALLWELLKEKPKFVTMIDIDDAVMRGCRKFMRSACGDCMDNYDGQNYKIIVGDAIAYMRDYHKEGLQFDYVFGDLTDVPISKTDRGEIWDFMRTIMNLGTSLLKPGTGKYMTHAIGVGCESALKMFEQNLSSLETPVTFTQTSAYVPSFMEKWCFYQATRKT